MSGPSKIPHLERNGKDVYDERGQSSNVAILLPNRKQEAQGIPNAQRPPRANNWRDYVNE
jgi:hypothetical protein